MTSAALDDILSGLTPYASSRLQEATAVLHEIRRRREMRLAALSGTVGDDDEQPIIEDAPVSSDDEPTPRSHQSSQALDQSPHVVGGSPSPTRGYGSHSDPVGDHRTANRTGAPHGASAGDTREGAVRAMTIAHEAADDVGSRLYLEGLRMRDRVARRVAVCRRSLEEAELQQLTLHPRVTRRAHRKAPKGPNYYKVNMQWRQRVDADVDKVRKMQRLAELRVVTAEPALCNTSRRIVDGHVDGSGEPLADGWADEADLPRRVGGRGRQHLSGRRRMGKQGRIYAGPVSGWRTHFERFQARRLGLLGTRDGSFVLSDGAAPSAPSINLRSLRMASAGPVGERLHHDAATRENRRLHLKSVYDALECVDPVTKQPLFQPLTNDGVGAGVLSGAVGDGATATSDAGDRASDGEGVGGGDAESAARGAARGVSRRAPAEWSEYLSRTHPAMREKRQEELSARVEAQRAAATPFRPKINARSSALAARARHAGRAPSKAGESVAGSTRASRAAGGDRAPASGCGGGSTHRSSASARVCEVAATPPPRKVVTREGLNTFLQRNNMLVLSRYRHVSHGLVEKSAAEGAHCTFAPRLNEQSVRLVNSARPVAVPVSLLEDAGLSASGEVLTRSVPGGLVAAAAATGGGGYDDGVVVHGDGADRAGMYEGAAVRRGGGGGGAAAGAGMRGGGDRRVTAVPPTPPGTSGGAAGASGGRQRKAGGAAGAGGGGMGIMLGGSGGARGGAGGWWTGDD